jgi:hypothetical protein
MVDECGDLVLGTDRSVFHAAAGRDFKDSYYRYLHEEPQNFARIRMAAGHGVQL